MEFYVGLIKLKNRKNLINLETFSNQGSLRGTDKTFEDTEMYKHFTKEQEFTFKVKESSKNGYHISVSSNYEPLSIKFLEELSEIIGDFTYKYYTHNQLFDGEWCEAKIRNGFVVRRSTHYDPLVDHSVNSRKYKRPYSEMSDPWDNEV